jgi:phosphoribosylformylglycinamidine cyclo-ligase
MTMITYKDAGVDVEKAEEYLDTIKARIQGTFTPLVLNPIGAFAALAEIPKDYREPVLVASTDGVGTKLKIAFLSGKHNSVGIDLVAMSVNDILTMGARPLFFLDYFACGKLDGSVYKDVIAGICDGCLTAGCSLIGGETAEMPSFYPEGEYDLAGFAMGIVEKHRVINGSTINEGDSVIGLASNGLHSNGYSLARKVLLDVHQLDLFNSAEGIGGTLYEELLRPTRIYVKPVLEVLNHFDIKGMAHITGGGLPGNIKRVIPDGLQTTIVLEKKRVPPIFALIARLGNIPMEEMYNTFNCGVGYILVVSRNDEESVLEKFSSLGESAWKLGVVERSEGPEKVRVSLSGY